MRILVRKILLSRFLERSPASVLRVAQVAEDAARQGGLFSGKRPAMCRRMLGRSARRSANVAEAAGGRIWIKNGRAHLKWSSPFFASEYVIDQRNLADRLKQAGSGRTEPLLRAVRMLLLLNTRNRIAHHSVQVLLRIQRDYLRSGTESSLVPLTEQRVAAEVQARLASADPSRISRLLRSITVQLPDGALRPLRSLCPSSRVVLRAHVRDALEEERRLRAQGALLKAWSDEQLAHWIARCTNLSVSRRRVAYCRIALGAPGARARSRTCRYMSETMNFSTLAPLTRIGIQRAAVPREAGVYELRIASDKEEFDEVCAGIIYLGQTNNLRRRLQAHAIPNSRNSRLARHVKQGRVLFRLRLETGDPADTERDLFRHFIETFERPPECNILRP